MKSDVLKPDAWCHSCKWQGVWDSSVCPECGARTKPIEWSRCRLVSFVGDRADIDVISSGCACGLHRPGAYQAPAQQFHDKEIKPGDEFWIVANLNGVPGQVMRMEEKS